MPSSSRIMSTAISSHSLLFKRNANPPAHSTSRDFPSGFTRGGRAAYLLALALRQRRHQAHADVHAFQLEMRPQPDVGGIIARILLVGDHGDFRARERLHRLDLFA